MGDRREDVAGDVLVSFGVAFIFETLGLIMGFGVFVVCLGFLFVWLGLFVWLVCFLLFFFCLFWISFFCFLPNKDRI